MRINAFRLYFVSNGGRTGILLCYELWTGGIIGEHISLDDEGSNLTVNGKRYHAIVTFLSKMKKLDLADIWFQHDGSTCHAARETMVQLNDEFGEELDCAISRL